MSLLALLLLACHPRDERCPAQGDAIVCDGGVQLTCAAGRLLDTAPCSASDVCVDGSGCLACAIPAPHPVIGVPVDASPTVTGEPWRLFAWTPLSLGTTGTVQLVGPEALEAYDATGLRVQSLTLPDTVALRATAGGDHTLRLQRPGCETATEITAVARRWPGLSATALATAPHATHVDAFLTGSTLRAAIDPERHPHLRGRTGALWVVPDRDRRDWTQDPTLRSAGPDPVPFALRDGSRREHLVALWEGVEVLPGRRAAFDLVWDVDGDGTLSAGDVIDGLDGPGAVVFGDLSAPGPYAVRTVDVSGGTFLTQRVTWPAELQELPAPAPLVVISHGNGHQYTWYDYLGDHLASHGYVVMAHANNTAPGVQSAATTTLTNTDAFVRNHALIDPALDGFVDTSRITWIGHSRGGEGVAIAWERLRSGTANVQQLQAADIALISAIAPTVFTSPLVANPGDRPFHMLAGSADGDVSGGVGDPLFGADCPVCQWWRLRQGATSLQAVTYLQGATHNDFCSLGPNDGFDIDVPKFGRPAAQAYTRALYLALLDHVVRGEPAIGEFLQRMPDDLALPTAPGGIVATQFRADPAGRRVIDDFQSEPALDRSSGGTAVRTSASDLVEGRLDDANTRFSWDPADPMNGMTESHDDDPAVAQRGLVLGWSGDASWEVDLPDDARDLHRFRHLTLRVAQQTRHPATVELDDALTFSIGLIDHTGLEVVLDTAARGVVPPPTARAGLGPGRGWANEFTTVRIPLADFEAQGLDRSAVRTVRLRFGPSWGSPIGRIGLDDLAVED